MAVASAPQAQARAAQSRYPMASGATLATSADAFTEGAMANTVTGATASAGSAAASKAAGTASQPR